MNPVEINKICIYPFKSRRSLVNYAIDNKKVLIGINADKILHSDEFIRTFINNNIGYCDGIGAVKVLHQKGFKEAKKIPGCELWLDIIKQLHKTKSFYLVGGRQEVIEEVVSKLQYQYFGINIIGFRNGYIQTPEEETRLLEDIKVKKPDVVFVAMGSPKQEILMEKMQNLNPALYQGLGGSFDVYVGSVKRAPKWWVDNNLEGAYRLIKQPFKIKRYLKALPFWWNFIVKRY